VGESYSGSFLVWNSSSFIRVVIGGIRCLGFDRERRWTDWRQPTEDELRSHYSLDMLCHPQSLSAPSDRMKNKSFVVLLHFVII